MNIHDKNEKALELYKHLEGCTVHEAQAIIRILERLVHNLNDMNITPPTEEVESDIDRYCF